MNQANFVGRLVREVEVKQLNSGARVVNNTIAVTRVYASKHSEEVTDFINIVAWNHLADLLAKYVAKGQQIAISGSMQSRNYEREDSQKVYVTECVVDSITLISRSHPKDSQIRNKDSGQAKLADNYQDVTDEVPAEELTKAVESVTSQS